VLQRLLVVLAAALAVVPVASAAADPTVTFSDGAVRVTGTPAADAFTVAAGDATDIVIDSATPFAAADDGVCSTLGTEATCEFDVDPSAPHAPGDVVFDLSGAGADSVDASGRGPAVRSVAVTYAGAPSGVAYTGGTPAHATVGGESDTLTGVDRVTGTAFADAFTGGRAAETLIGGDGDDAFDVTGGDGPADSVDCGAGTDTIRLRPGVDTQTGCEVLNGLGVVAPPSFPPPPSGPPATGAPPVPVQPPTFRAPTKVTGGTIDVTVTCSACAGQVATVLPPPSAPAGLPPGWNAPGFDLTLQALLQVMSLSGNVAQLERDLRIAMQQWVQLAAAAGQAQSALERAQLDQARARAEAMLLIVQAAIASAGNATGGKTMAKLKGEADKADNKLETPLNGVKLPSAKKSSAAAAKRPTARALARWLLLRTARALPTIHPKVTPTAKPGVYRARITAPSWLRATSRVLRRSGVKTLPVRISLGTTTASLRLPLPR
jgi:hypothetical protein